MAAVMAGESPAATARVPLARRLRVGLFADTRLQPRWIVEAFDKVARSDFAELVAVRAGEARPEQAVLVRLYEGVDRYVFGADGCERVDLFTLLPPAEQPPELARLDLDVAFLIGELDEREFDGLARFGVWRFCFGADGRQSEAAAGWHEVASAAPVSGSGIKVRLRSDLPPRLAYQSWTRTYPLSVARTRAQMLRKTSEFVCRALAEVHRAGSDWLEQCRPLAEPAVAGASRCAPGNGELLRTLPVLGARIAGRAVQKALTVDQWSLAWRFCEGAWPVVSSELEGFIRAVPPRDREWADPFPIEKNGRYFIFFEEMRFAEGKGHISMIEVRRDGTWSAPVRVLERDHHLSYPFLVEEAGELYMIPESARSGAVEVYRCVDFPWRWKLERRLLEGVRLVDCTFHRAGDRWWMFANAAANGARFYDDELHLFHARSLLGAWQPHPRNPVKSDARSARPAGRLFVRGASLYRPAQICVPRYGAGLSINRVVRLTPQEYAERQVERILPGGRHLGLHTVNRAGELTAIDVFNRRSRFA